MTFDANDPRWTAFALGELPASDAAEFEKLAATDPAAKAFVDETRETASLLRAAFTAEPAVGLTSEQRSQLLAESVKDEPAIAGSFESAARASQVERSTKASSRRWPFQVVLGSAIAAGLALVFVGGYELGRMRPSEEVQLARLDAGADEAKDFAAAAPQLRQAIETETSYPPSPAAPAGGPAKEVAGAAIARVPSREEAAMPPPPDASLLAKTTPTTPGDKSAAPKGAPFIYSLDPLANSGKPSPARDGAQVALRENTALAPASPAQTSAAPPAGQPVPVERQAGDSRGLARRSQLERLKEPKAANGRVRESYYKEDRQFADRLGHAGGLPDGNHVRGTTFGLQPKLAEPQLGRSPFGEFKRFPEPAVDAEAYAAVVDNPFQTPTRDPLSTFSIDVDTASYANIRRFLNQGSLPPKDAVRIEEMINYFRYADAPPTGDQPFSVNLEAAACPWDPTHRLVRVGLKGRVVPKESRPMSNLVFLVDVSGSMQPENKLPLLKKSMKMLVDQLGENDRVAIVVYAGASGLVLPSTSVASKEVVLSALDRLEAGGSTNGGAGIELAYQCAAANFIKGGTNRVILATDGDFNVGVTNQNDLVKLIEEKAKTGVFLTVLGFGMGNIKDATLEKLADKGNGHYAYIDDLAEARKVLVDEIGGTLVTIAKDVKIQVEFNPAKVAGYRLIGYENRLMAAEDFNNDAKDAGEIGAGHGVTALYEIIPAGLPVTGSIDPLKYQTNAAKPAPTAAAPANAASANDRPASEETLTVKLRYKAPDGDKSKLIEAPLVDKNASYPQASGDLKLAASVAAFGMLLRESPYKGAATYARVKEWASEAPTASRRELIDLIDRAANLTQVRPASPVAPR